MKEKYNKEYSSFSIYRIVSVSPLAKNEYSITRENTVDEAQEICSNLLIIRKGTQYNKPESRKLRHASWDVLDAIVALRLARGWAEIMEIYHSPSDEFYFGLTKILDSIPIGTTFCLKSKCFGELKQSQVFRKKLRMVFDNTKESRYLYGIYIIDQFRPEILKDTGFYSSGAVAVNKIQAKFACALHKPNGLTIMNKAGFGRNSGTNFIQQLKGFGGDLGGRIIENINNDDPEMTIARLQQSNVSELMFHLGITEAEAESVHNLCRGHCDEDVVEKLMTKHVSAGKSNFGRPSLQIQYSGRMKRAFYDLFEELCDKIEEDFRRHNRTGEEIQVFIDVEDPDDDSRYNELEFRVPYELFSQYRPLTQMAFKIFKISALGWFGKVEKIKLQFTPTLIYQ